MRSKPSNARAKPRYNWEVMTPLFPRAPRKAPLARASAACPALRYSLLLISFMADIMVSDMLVPVSPSGTGKTFRASTASRFLSNMAAPAETMSRSSRPSIVLVCINGVSS